MRTPIIGVMGPGEGAAAGDLQLAYELGRSIAQEKWITLSGGRNCGVMDAVSRGAHDAGGLTIGILLGEDDSACSPAVDLAVITGMGSARNNINVLTSSVVIACGMGQGTASEVALALKAGKPVILLNSSRQAIEFFSGLAPHYVYVVQTPAEAIERCRVLLKR